MLVKEIRLPIANKTLASLSCSNVFEPFKKGYIIPFSCALSKTLTHALELTKTFNIDTVVFDFKGSLYSWVPESPRFCRINDSLQAKDQKIIWTLKSGLE